MQLVVDITVMVEDETSVVNVLDIIYNFSNVSGIILNNDKTEGLWLGPKHKQKQTQTKIKTNLEQRVLV